MSALATEHIDFTKRGPKPTGYTGKIEYGKLVEGKS